MRQLGAELGRSEHRHAPRTVWTWAAIGLVALISASLAYALFRKPLQLSDNLVVLLDAQAPASLWELMRSRLDSNGYLRPLFWAQVRMLINVGGEQVLPLAQAVHVTLVVLLIGLFAYVLKIRTWIDATAFSLASVTLIGMHSFFAVIVEAYPINHGLEVVVCTLAALALSGSRGGVWVDVLAVGLFTGALVTQETGLLVWVCFVTARLTGLRGVSRASLWTATSILAAYLILRFVAFPIGVPALSERSTGFGFSKLEPHELELRFGGNPLLFYAYNVMSAALTMVLSEPRSGVFVFARALSQGNLEPLMLINVISSALMTGLMVWFAAAHVIPRWRAGGVRYSDRIFVVCAAVTIGNAIISFPYNKDYIVATGGAFYAVAAFFAIQAAVARVAASPGAWLSRLACCVVLVASSAGWSARAALVHVNLQHAAFEHRSEWARMPRWLAEQGIVLRSDQTTALVARMQHQVIQKRVPNPSLRPQWMNRYVDHDR